VNTGYASGGEIGDLMYGWAEDLFPFNRSITGNGVRETLNYLKRLIPDLVIHEVPSGVKAFDWTVPEEWNIESAYIENHHGVRIVDFNNNNLHVVGYSIPIDAWMSLDELDLHLHSIPMQPDVIPYETSYYELGWGFCITDRQRKSLEPGVYHVVINSRLESGSMTYAECIIPGDTADEILLSTYVCHPSLANNEISGPVVSVGLIQWINTLRARKYTYRIVFVPETIGAIYYISKHLQHLKKVTQAGFVVTCVGDDRNYSFLPSRKGNTLSDRVARHVFDYSVKDYKEYSYLDRGSDERQYCSPGVDLPIASMMRSKYGTYPEYHTSADDLSMISAKGLYGGFRVIRDAIYILENNVTIRSKFPCEPQMCRRDIENNKIDSITGVKSSDIMNILAYADGTQDLIEIAETVGLYVVDLLDLVNQLRKYELVELRT
jgi:aminopeptidase-like protein